MATVKNKSGKKSFEDALAELESVTGQLESGDLTLDAALDAFESGVGLMRVCDEHLRTARGRLIELSQGENGKLISQILGEAPESFANTV